MAAETLLLDLDGTVWNSRAWYADAIAQLSSAQASEIATRLEAGESVPGVSRDYGVSDTRLARAASENGTSIELYERVFDTLDRLRARGTGIGIVSNLSGWLARPLLVSTGIEAYVTATVTPRWGVPAKPKPHGIRRVLEEMGRRPDAGTWFVGDGRTDAEAAQAAGVQFAWASYGYETDAPPGTAKVLARFEDVLEL